VKTLGRCGAPQSRDETLAHYAYPRETVEQSARRSHRLSVGKSTVVVVGFLTEMAAMFERSG
jgi:hypothetical protein